MLLLTPRCRLPDFVPPKRPYSFLAMLDDILDFASETLVDHGRLSFWMPTANDEEQEIPVPEHPCLEIVAVCVQVFNKCTIPDPLSARVSKQAHMPLCSEMSFRWWFPRRLNAFAWLTPSARVEATHHLSTYTGQWSRGILTRLFPDHENY